MSSTHVVIIAGGAGTRFWPSGRRARPKQLLPIAGKRTMLAETLTRCAPLAPPERTWVVTNEVQAEATRRECPDLAADHVIAEPLLRNTAAAIGLAGVTVRRSDPDAVMVVLPADHVIKPQAVFEEVFLAAIQRARAADVLLTVGIKPTGPATGYGYIEGGDAVDTIGGIGVHRVLSFKEKPAAAAAAEFIASGRYFWNSGTFVWTVQALLDAFERHLPGHFELLRRIAETGEVRAEDYAGFESVPVDIGIMEKADNVEVIPAAFEWDDVGSWLAIDRLNPRDDAGNVVRGTHVGIDTQNCIVICKGEHVIATVGIADMIVVHTPDATLICPKDRAEEVRRVVDRLQERDLEQFL